MGGGNGGELRTGGQDLRKSGSTESWNTGLKVGSGKKIRVKDNAGAQGERK
jgi:hypothetical protein